MSRTWLFAVAAFAVALCCLCSNSFAGQSALAPWQTDPLGQNTSAQAVILQGDIAAANSVMQNWTAELAPVGGGAGLRTTVRGNGSFQFPAAPAGEYELRIHDAAGRVAFERVLSLHEHYETVSIRPEGSSSQDSAASAISFQTLRHKIPRQALNSFKKGNQAIKKNDFSAAAHNYQAALHADPEFAEAFNDLGAAYYRLGRKAEAVEAFQKAVELDPAYRQANDNLCMTLFQLKRLPEAVEAADRVLKGGSASPKTHYVKAVTLLAAGGDRTEVLDHLWRAEDAVPEARLVAAGVLADAGRRTDAAHQLEEYLRSSKQTAFHADVEKWLLKLKQ